MYRAVEKYVVRLSAEERAELEAMTRQRRIAADKQLRAKLLLHADEGELGPAYLDQQLVEEFGVSLSTVTRLRRQLVLEGFRAALSRRTNRRRSTRPFPPRKLAASSKDWKSITRPNTAVGLTWRRPSWVSSAANASTAACRTKTS